MNNIERISFTGVDSKTDMDRLLDIQSRYPKSEFGVFVGSITTDSADNGILPKLSVVRNFGEVGLKNNTQCTIHLCGNWVRTIMEPLKSFGLSYGYIIDTCQSFSRVQIWIPEDEELKIKAIERFVENVIQGRPQTVVLPHSNTATAIPLQHDRVEYIHYTRKSLEMATRLLCHPLPCYTYAGDLGLQNISRIERFAKRYKDFSLWFAMEMYNLRKDDKFDLDIVKQICQRIFADKENGSETQEG